MTERIVFAIQDEDNNYCGSNSIQYDDRTKEWDFVYTKELTNGFFIHMVESLAQEEIDKLNDRANQLNFKKEFHIKKLDLNKVLYDEYNESRNNKHPFIHELICIMDKATLVVA